MTCRCVQDNGEWVASQANFTSLATPNAIGSGKTALNTLLHEGQLLDLALCPICGLLVHLVQSATAGLLPYLAEYDSPPGSMHSFYIANACNSVADGFGRLV